MTNTLETPISPEISRADFLKSQNFEQQINHAVADAYQEVAEEYDTRLMDPRPEQIYWQPMCQEFSEKLMAKLRGLQLQGLDLQPAYIYINRLPETYQNHFRHHILVTIKNPKGEDMLIDGTWQQFLEKPKNNLKTLVAKPETALNLARTANLPKEIQSLWETADSMLKVRKLLTKFTLKKQAQIITAVSRRLNIQEKDIANFAGLRCNFQPDAVKQILETFQEEIQK